MKETIVIIDYGLGNPLSIKNMLKKAGYIDTIISNEHDIITQAKKLIFA